MIAGHAPRSAEMFVSAVTPDPDPVPNAQGGAGSPPPEVAIRVPREWRHAAARRLVAGATASATSAPVGSGRGARDAAAERFLATAPDLGIDVSDMFAVVRDAGRDIGPVCLLIPGSGRTGMVFTSPIAGIPSQIADLAAAIDAAARAAKDSTRDEIVMLQAIADPSDTPTHAALDRAGFERLATLAYLRLPLGRSSVPPPPALPAGIALEPVGDVNPRSPGRRRLARTLEETYADTLDCPGLRGLRTPDDIIESHLSVGRGAPAMWSLVVEGARSLGCVLLNHCPAQSCVELVYIGLAPALRGRGLGAPLLAHAIRRAAQTSARELTCAVDTRNTPAERMYQRAGMTRLAERVAFVRAIRAPN
ncbi:MAG: GNAT family N-acetyltransferase [Phycisphaerales bacterium]|jgi:RimJ/RimL family protein N-acetyltransferase|nr:GNAT family N-acetyltransferase [Phycisphaerales bacterium]